MRSELEAHTAGFHEGELAVQRRAGVANEAARLSNMLASPDLTGGMSRFLADRTFAAVTARDVAGRLGTSPLIGLPGFLRVVSPTELEIAAVPAGGDPLADLPVGQPLGMVVIEFGTRRRVRINGTLVDRRDDSLVVAVDQAYGNCPQYIQRRSLTVTELPASRSSIVRRSAKLGHDEIAEIRRADTFFIGTSHPTRGTDSSHRGGPSGFVRVDDDGLVWWPDYSGNNMFNTLGNLAVDPVAALLFVNFDTNAIVQLSGTATLEWIEVGASGDDDDTGRRVVFRPEAVASGHLVGLRASATEPYLDNPPLTDVLTDR